MNIGRSRLVLVVLIVIATTAYLIWGRTSANLPLTRTAVLTLDRGAVLTVNPTERGGEFTVGAVGLSMEAGELETDRLSAVHPSLVRLMRLLGPAVLRVGGNSVDTSWWTSSGEARPQWANSTVTPADLDRLHGLLAATGWRVLLGVNLGHFEPQRIADEARHAHEILGSGLAGIEIGNEPDDFGDPQVALRPPTYGVDEYLHEAEAYDQALMTATPGIAVDGPAVTQDSTWLTQMGSAASMFTEITKHYYPASECPGIPPSDRVPQPTAAGLLSPVVRQRESADLASFAEIGAIVHRPTRIGETNSVACGGSASASPVFASALWSLDWALRAASSGVVGVNFHDVLGVCGSHSYSPICAPSARAASAGDVIAQPEYYGLLAASRLEGGRFVATSLDSPLPLPDLTTWATVAPDGVLTVAIDNFATAGTAQVVSIAMPGYAATEEALVGPAVGARGGVTLGAAAVAGKGRWDPKPAKLSPANRALRVDVRPASAVIITLRSKQSQG